MTLGLGSQMRVQQTIKSQEGSITSYKIANILQFYMITMRRTIGEEALLSRTLKEYAPSYSLAVILNFCYRITDLAYKAFFDAIEAHGRSLLRFLHVSLCVRVFVVTSHFAPATRGRSCGTISIA